MFQNFNKLNQLKKAWNCILIAKIKRKMFHFITKIRSLISMLSPRIIYEKKEIVDEKKNEDAKRVSEAQLSSCREMNF